MFGSYSYHLAVRFLNPNISFADHIVTPIGAIYHNWSIWSSFIVVFISSNEWMISPFCRLLLVAAFLWNHPTKGYLGVFMFPQSYVKLKDVVASPQIKKRIIQRLVVRLIVLNVCSIYIEFHSLLNDDL